MGKFLNPFTDIGFKKLFGQEVHKDLLIEFLNDLLVGERHIEDLSFLNKEIVPESLGGKVVIMDVLCIDKDGTRFIIEMQNQYQDYFLDRYGIYFLNFSLPVLSKFRTDIVLADRENGEMVSDKLRLIYLSLPRFTREASKCETDFERWIYLLKHMETLDRMPFEAQKAVFKKLLDVADVESLSPEERYRYDETLKAYRDYVNTIASAERISREKGFAEGEAKGEAKGKTIVAANLKRMGIDVDTIAKSTGLSPEEIALLE